MPSEEFSTSEPWLIKLLGPHAVEIRERNLIVHSELDSKFQMRRDPMLDVALKQLFRFVFSTIPNGCEIYLASARTIASVRSLGSGTLTLRWQVVGESRTPGQGEATRIRPIAGGAEFHSRSKAARELRWAFAEAGWALELDATNGDRELWVHASTR